MAGRSKPRRRISANYLAAWKDSSGREHSAVVQGRDTSKSGMGIDSTIPLEVGTQIRLQTETHELVGEGVVRYCMRRGTNYAIGVEFTKEGTGPGFNAAPQIEDHYEVLQISPRADSETIRRVYRIMAARFHPDNKETGSMERFLQLKRAFEVLSDPEQRELYDANHQSQQEAPMPIFEAKEFVEGMDGEMNRRLGVLSLLYHQRRTDEAHPGISVLELEKRMSFPREYLHFTTWYLRSKGYVTVEDNSDFILTAAGVDYIEEHSPTNVVLQRLMLPSGSPIGDETTKAAGK